MLASAQRIIVMFHFASSLVDEEGEHCGDNHGRNAEGHMQQEEGEFWQYKMWLQCWRRDGNYRCTISASQEYIIMNQDHSDNLLGNVSMDYQTAGSQLCLPMWGFLSNHAQESASSGHLSGNTPTQSSGTGILIHLGWTHVIQVNSCKNTIQMEILPITIFQSTFGSTASIFPGPRPPFWAPLVQEAHPAQKNLCGKPANNSLHTPDITHKSSKFDKQTATLTKSLKSEALNGKSKFALLSYPMAFMRTNSVS